MSMLKKKRFNQGGNKKLKKFTVGVVTSAIITQSAPIHIFAQPTLDINMDSLYNSKDGINNGKISDVEKKLKVESNMNLNEKSYTQESAFVFDSSTGTIRAYDTNIGGTDVNIPPTIGGVQVTSIGANAFLESGLTSVSIPDSVTSIGQNAFKSNKLTSVIIPPNIESIERYVFDENNISSVIIPSGVTSIGDYAFSANQLKSVYIPEGVTYIGNSAFIKNQLTSLNIPNTVRQIKSGAFQENKLTNVVIPDGMTTIESNAFAVNQLQSVTIPKSVTLIASAAFYDNQLTNVDIPESVTRIGQGAFKNNRLTSVVIPKGITTINKNTFLNNQLESITIPDTVTVIDMYAFKNNKLGKVTLPKGIIRIADYAFEASGVTSVTIPKGVQEIGDKAFFQCRLASLSIPESVYYVGNLVISENSVLDVGYEIKDSKYIVDLKKLDPNLDIEKVSNVVGGDYNINTGIITLDRNPEDVMDGVYDITYNYNVKNRSTSSPTNSIKLRLGNLIINEKPIINGANDISIKEGAVFDPMDGVSAQDVEDGIITDKIIISGNVDTSKPGRYELTYSVSDSYANTTTIKRIITVNHNMSSMNSVPVINANDKTINLDEQFDPLEGVTALDLEDGDITSRVRVKENNIINKIGSYKVVYEVTDNGGATTTKAITVTLKSDDSIQPPTEGGGGGISPEVITHNGYIKGYPDKTFKPKNYTTRAEFSVMLARILLDGNNIPIKDNKYPDVNSDNFANKEISYLSSMGILLGYEDGTFRPDNKVTRAEIASILARIDNSNNKKANIEAFLDISDSHWAKTYIEDVKNKGLMIGYEDNTFKPDNSITRDEVVVSLNRIYRESCNNQDLDNLKMDFTDVDKNNWAYKDILKASVNHKHSK